MAASAKHFSFLFCLALFSSLHALARDSQFFSKVTNPTTTTPAATTYPKEKVEGPNEEPLLSKHEQDPNFIPDTQNGYGLYNQETDQFPTTTNPASTASNLPYKTESEQPYYDDNKQAYVTNPQGTSNTRFMDRGYSNNYNSNNNNKQAYVTNPQGMSDTRFMDRGYTNTNNNNYYMNKGYNIAATDNYYNGGNSYNTQQQGMSDTRFLENGRYFYDIQSENNYNNGYGSSRGVDNYNKGHYGNSYNENSYVVNNSMEGYQNPEQFQEGQEEYVP